MNTNSTFLQQYSLLAYLILTPLISNAIALFLPIPTVVIALLMVLVPVGMAILLTALAEGRNSLRDLLKKLSQWRLTLKWYAVALLMPMGIILISAVLAFLLGWTPAIQFTIPEPSMLIINSVVALLAGVLEEFGWRGYALPRLLKYRSPLISALIIGIAHGILHIGLGLSVGRPWLPTFLNPFALSIVLTWMFLHTRGNLGMAILYHFALDFFPQFFLLPLGLTNAQGVWSQAIVILAVAFILILYFGVNLQRNPMKELAPA
jgi:membrane protease YdiL (CAAX protease family)